jgi:hypothetical protein
VRRVWLLASVTALACSDGAVESGTKPLPADSFPAPTRMAVKELIPAEWTVFEDTSQAGEVTTASLQLPTARVIQDLWYDEPPRLLLRCLDGQVEAFIDAESEAAAESPPDSSRLQTVRIQLDAAPPCE